MGPAVPTHEKKLKLKKYRKAGHESFTGMAVFPDCHFADLKRLFPLSYRASSHDTFQRLFDSINPDTVLECFMLFTKNLAQRGKGLAAIDGKSIRNSGKDGNQQHVVSAWCEENRLVLGQVTGKGKIGSELSAMKELIRLLDVQGRIITVDALGCQREIVQLVKDKDGDYFRVLKQNQKNLLEDVKPYFADLTNWKGHSIENELHWGLDVTFKEDKA